MSLNHPSSGRQRRQRQHRSAIRVDEIDWTGSDRAELPLVRAAEPIGELGIEVGRRVEPATWHERRLEEPVAPLDHPLGFGVVRAELMHLGGQRAAELADAGREAPTSTNAGSSQLSGQSPRSSGWREACQLQR